MNISKSVQLLQDTFDINAIYAQKIVGMVDSSNLLEEAKILIEEKPKPFVKWVGGKRQLLKQFRLMELYPPEKFNIKTGRYFEPFVGGGAVFFDLLPEKSFLSDLNSELVTTYNVIKNDVDRLINSLEKYKYEKEFFLKVRSMQPKQLPDVEIASRFIYLNR